MQKKMPRASWAKVLPFRVRSLMGDFLVACARPCARGVGLHALPVVERHQDLARLAALELADQALGRHQLEEARGAGVADRERALQEARGSALRLQDDA